MFENMVVIYIKNYLYSLIIFLIDFSKYFDIQN